MTDKAKVEEKKRKDREFREFPFELRSAQLEDGGQELYAEGYAVVFNVQTVIWEYDGIQYKEQVDGQAFSSADMTDVIFNYNHSGKVMARTRNETLKLTIDTKGLYVQARLDGTQEGRDLYEEIQGGYIDRMSFAFTTQEESYDSQSRLRSIMKVKKLYDVSAVDIPAYDTTSISARSFFELENEKERKAAELAAELRRKKLFLQTQL